MEPLSPSLRSPRSDSAPLGGRPRPQPRTAPLRGAATPPPASLNTITLQALTQRLSLLAAIELPCAVQLSHLDHDHGAFGRIRSCGSSGGCFRLSGESFSLELNEATIDSVRLTDKATGGGQDTCIEILATNGKVMARIKGAPERSDAAVWQDIMDTFDCM